ncbi:MAG: hypothetical protein DRP76_02235, partial [Candidatus Omnitrophota bacterium]
IKQGLRDDFYNKFSEPKFIDSYANVKKLVSGFKNYLVGLSPFDGRFFFRFYILELWARKFFQ